MKIRLKASIVNSHGESFMGIGLVWLLQRIRKFKSIHRAAADMELSYVKALKILNCLEKNLGRKVVIRTRGGMTRGGAEITPFAERYIEEYDRFLSELNADAKKKFKGFRILSHS
jgi:molybdate transport system regulatory protein